MLALRTVWLLLSSITVGLRTSTPTRTALQAKVDAVNQASGATHKADPAGMIFQTPPPPPTEVKLVQQTGDAAVLQVKEPQGDGQVRLVKEAAGWRIDLVVGTAGIAGRAVSAVVERAADDASRWSDHAPVTVAFDVPAAAAVPQ